MSIITCFARLTDTQLRRLNQSSTTLTRLHENVPPDGEVIGLDKAAGVIAWLLSPRKRAEQVEFAVHVNEQLGQKSSLLPARRPLPPLDEFAICIEGRGLKKLNDLDVGYGPACEFSPEDVKKYSDALSKVTDAVLRRELNFELMDRLHLPIEFWQEQGEEMFTEYILPHFEKLQRFYRAAASAGQTVLVWHS